MSTLNPMPGLPSGSGEGPFKATVDVLRTVVSVTKGLKDLASKRRLKELKKRVKGTALDDRHIKTLEGLEKAREKHKDLKKTLNRFVRTYFESEETYTPEAKREVLQAVWGFVLSDSAADSVTESYCSLLYGRPKGDFELFPAAREILDDTSLNPQDKIAELLGLSFGDSESDSAYLKWLEDGLIELVT